VRVVEGARGHLMKTVVEKLVNCFLLLYLKYESESESGQENEHELTEYLEFRKRTNSSRIMSNTVGMRKFNIKYRPTVHSIKQVYDQIHKVHNYRATKNQQKQEFTV